MSASYTESKRIVVYTPGLTPQKALLSALKSRIESSSTAHLSGTFRTLSPLADAINRLEVCLAATTEPKVIEIIGPAIGSPAAELVANSLRGETDYQLILFGVAGGISSPALTLAIGDCLTPNAIYKPTLATADIASQTNGNSVLTFEPSEIQLRILELVGQRHLKSQSRAHRGAIWTVDSLAEESGPNVRAALNQGVLGVDMEFAAVAQACIKNKIEFAALFVVSDLVSERPESSEALGSIHRSKDLKRSLLDNAELLAQMIVPN